MKFLKKSIYALSMMSMLGLWACSSDELLPGTTIEGDPVSVKITVSRACDQTRTIISENKETGGLNNVWEKDDRLAFFNANGEKAGELVLTEGEGYSTAVFEGEVVGTTGDYQLWYFGKPADGDYSYIEFKGGTKKKAVVDLSNQNFESPQELSARDIMSASVSINIDGKKATVAHNVTMYPQLAMARFTLAGIPEDADGTLTISNASSETMIYKAQCDLAEGSTGPVSGSAGTGITIKNVNADRDVFVALYPASYTLKFKFETTSGDIYSYAFTQPAEIEAGKYYTAFDKEEGAENGTFAGVKVPFEEVVVENLIAADQNANPLKKWATTNLVFNTSTRTSSFASSVYDGGSLYQWGRNDGYADYKDAMGELLNTGNYSYATYNIQAYAGEGFSDASTGLNKSSVTYTSATELKTITANMRIFFINTNGSSYYDYWPWTNVDGGYNWETRAKACSYSTSSPAPSGYRLPKKDDFKKIFPTQGYSWDGTNNLASNVNGKLIELKEIPNVCKYAIRWDIATNNGKKYLKIRSVVVSDSFTEADLEKLTWNESEIEERIFPATGAIEAYIHTHTNSQYVTMFVARPLPFGNWNVEILGSPSLINAKYWAVQYKNIVDAGKTEEGSYWVSDDTYIFRFRNNNGKFGSDNTTSFIGASDQPTSNAFAIRCVQND